jgi:hypothetical protein
MRPRPSCLGVVVGEQDGRADRFGPAAHAGPKLAQVIAAVAAGT